MMTLRAAIEHGKPDKIVNGVAELETTLRDAAAQSQARGILNIIFLYAPNNDHLTLVVGGDETVVGFNYANGEPPYFASLGDSDNIEPLLVAFVGLEHHTEFPRKWSFLWRRGEAQQSSS